MSAPELVSGEVCPRRFGLNYDPPAIILEYLEVSTGKLFHRKVALKRLRSSTDPARVAEKLRQVNRPLLTEERWVKKLQQSMHQKGSTTSAGTKVQSPWYSPPASDPHVTCARCRRVLSPGAMADEENPSLLRRDVDRFLRMDGKALTMRPPPAPAAQRLKAVRSAGHGLEYGGDLERSPGGETTEETGGGAGSQPVATSRPARLVPALAEELVLSNEAQELLGEWMEDLLQQTVSKAARLTRHRSQRPDDDTDDTVPPLTEISAEDMMFKTCSNTLRYHEPWDPWIAMDSHGIHGAIHVTFGDGFEQPTDEACSSFQRCLPDSTTLGEVKQILAAWAGAGGSLQQQQRLASQLRSKVQLMLADGGYAGVDPAHLAIFAQSPSCPRCASPTSPTSSRASFGRAASCLKDLGGQCSFQDGGGRVIYQVGARAQCGNCWLAEVPESVEQPDEIDYHQANLNKLSNDELARHKSDGILHLPEELSNVAERCGSATLLDCSISLLETTVHLTVTRGGDSRILFHPSSDRGPYRCAELFGGLGGWSYAANLWKTTVTVIVEHDERTAMACARAMQTEVLSAETFCERAVQGRISTPVVVRCDVRSTLLWMGMSILNVGYILASPPCQSWSTVGAGGGLASPDGEVFAPMLKNAGYMRVLALLAENVPGITRHPDYGVLITGGAMDGMRLILSGTFKCQRALPVQRDRWLATFIHVSLSVEPSIIKQAMSFTFASKECNAGLPGPTLKSADVIIHDMDPNLRRLLTPDADAIALLTDPEYLPPAWKSTQRAGEEVLRTRAIKADEQISGIMARYGSQHKLPLNHLKDKGLFTVLYMDCNGYRYFSPWEVVASLGFPECVILDEDLTIAQQQAGNAISIAHAWLQIGKTHIILGQNSPFALETTFPTVIQQMQQEAIKMTGKIFRTEDGFTKICPAPATAQDTAGTSESDTLAKRQRTEQIPPTVPFQVDRDLGYTEAVDFAPTFISHELAKTNGPQPFAMGGLMFIQHFQSNWMSVAHGQQKDVVATMVVRALPHAKSTHFMKLQGPDGPVEWDTEVQCVPPFRLIFQPSTFQICCVLPNEKILMSADVTWTIETVLAYVASSMKCQVPALQLTNGDLPTRTCDFLAEYEKQEYKVSFKLTMPGYVSFAAPEAVVETSAKVVLKDECRFVATHPSMKVARTSVVKCGQTIGDVVKSLFPHLASTTAWGVSINGLPIAPDKLVSDVDQFVIDWQCFQPLAPTAVEKCKFTAPIDSAITQIGAELNSTRWVKSPFSTRAQVLRIADECTIKQIAASFVVHTNMNITIMCTMGGTVVHPDANLASIANTDVLVFRVSPLKGGAKQSQDQLRNKIKHVLQQHGVEAEAVQGRADAFLAKCDHETLMKAVNTDDITFWDELKQEANRIKFRLVFRNELTRFRNDGREKPPNKAAKPSVKTPKAFVANPTNIKIDMEHFTDDDQPVELLDPQRFGPDQAGLAIMNCKDADRRSNTPGTQSMEGLAILVVGRVFQDDDQVFTMPAYTSSGAPIVIQAALRQFGDRHIQFKAAVPKTMVSQSASTAVEIHIFRNEVAKWADCSVPLHYLGVHVSAVRGSSLIAQWAFRTYTAARAPASFKDSAYWHGYVRVQDEIWTQFSVIVMPECSLAEAQKRASAHDKALGIVKVKEQYAVRCRREHATALRAALLPESAFVAMEAVSSDEQLWLLKHVPAEIGKGGLQQALTAAEWNAHPVRAQGLDRWVVASNTSPPCRHLCINNAFVLVEPFKRPHEGPAVTMIAKQFKVETLVKSSPTGHMQVATTSRYQEMKADLSEQMEQKLADATGKIEVLAQQMQVMQTMHAQEINATKAELAMVRDEQTFAKQKLQEVETSITQSSHSVIKTMQDMFTQMQSTLEHSMKQSIESSMQVLVNDDDNKRARGWVDAAKFDAHRRGVEPQPTCRNATRRTFILINPCLLAALEHCDVTDTYDFDAHPLLLAKFGLSTVLLPKQVWMLPTSTEGFFFDEELLEEAAVKHQQAREPAFQKAKGNHETGEMLRQTTLVFEDCLRDACVTTDGHAQKLPQGCFGRCRKSISKKVPAATPVIKHAREGHFNPEVAQATVSIRRRTKQVRRLQSLSELLARHQVATIDERCHELWRCILRAPGYHHDFQHFAMHQLGLFVPSQCPNVEYVKYLTLTLRNWVQDEVKVFNKNVMAKRHESVLRDIKQGGGQAFASVRDPPQPPYHSIHMINKVEVTRQRWVKEGRLTLNVSGDCSVFDLDRPVKTKVIAKQRLAKAKRVLTRLRKKRLPKHFKVQMTNQLSASLVGYGSEVTYYTHSEFTSLRAACCKATGRAWSGCNPHLSMFAAGDARDPELAMLIRKCFFWRRYLRRFPQRTPDFQYKLQCTHGKQSTGPVGVFVRTLHDHGWSVSEQGYLIHSRGWVLDWMQVSKGHLVRMLSLSWNVKVCRIVGHRKHFEAECIDVTLGKRGHKLTVEQRPHAISLVIGRHVTRDALVHYPHGTTTDKCPLCGNRDGRFHRFQDCAGLAEVRSRYPKVMRWLQQQSSTTIYYGLLPLDLTLADAVLGDWSPIPEFLPPEDTGDAMVCAFTDGSALHNRMFFTTKAAGAFVICDHTQVLQQHAEPLPGQEQSAYRGEIWGLILLMAAHVRVHVHADCAAMLNVLQQLLVARRSNSKPGYSDHIDLWSIVWELLVSRPVDAVQWTKVRAHTAWKQSSCADTRWKGAMNDRVDALAKECAHKSLRPHTGATQKFEAKRTRDHAHLVDYHVMIAECNTKCLAASQRDSTCRTATMPVFELPFEASRAFRLSCKLPKKVLAKCPVGGLFAERLCSYFSQLEWDPEAPTVSPHELLVDFMLTTRTLPPVHVIVAHHNRKQPTKAYMLPDQSIAAAEQARQTSFAALLMVWRSGVRWLMQNWLDNPLGAQTSPCPDEHQLFGESDEARGRRLRIRREW
eukprot:Skav213136  [mRNA]  locus=scaffold107:376351:402111:+ [translate_table: standard]